MYFLGNKDNILIKMVTTNRIFEGITASRYVVYLESHVGVLATNTMKTGCPGSYLASGMLVLLFV